MRAPIVLDASQPRWPIALPIGRIICINMVHISPLMRRSQIESQVRLRHLLTRVTALSLWPL